MTAIFEAIRLKLAVHIGTELAMLVLAIIASAIIWPIITWIWGQILHAKDFIQSRRRALGAVARKVSSDGVREGDGVWSLGPISHPENYKSNLAASKILAVANLKGGVGKTTIAANIAAHLAHSEQWQKRVLLVDLDYQGSLSSMAFGDEQSWLPPKGADSIATLALSGDIQPSVFLQACKNVGAEARLQIVTAHYDLAQADNRILVEWLLNKKSADHRTIARKFSDLLLGRAYVPNEMRYNLAKLLHSEAVRSNFDLVVIDCPPRLTTGTIQALCASTHVLIPTLLDRTSCESVVSFCEQIENMKKANLCPHISYVGVVASRFTQHTVAWQKPTADLKGQLEERNYGCGFLPSETFIPQTVDVVRNSESGIAYFNLGGTTTGAKAKQAIVTLAEHVASELGLAKRPNFAANLQLVLPVAVG